MSFFQTIGGLLGAAAPFLPPGFNIAAGVLGGLAGASQGSQAQGQANQQYSTEQDLAHQEAQRQQALYNAASPYYGGTLSTLFQNAGLGAPGGSVYGAPEQRAQLNQAETDLRQGYAGDAAQLRHQMNIQGIGNSATTAAALTRLAQGQDQSLAEFRRNLAIHSVDLQNSRLQQALAAAGIGLGASTLPAAGVYGQLGNVAQGQANQANQGVQGIFGALTQQKSLQALLHALQGGAGGGSGYYPGTYGTGATPGGYGTNVDLGGGLGINLPPEFR